MFQVTPMMMKSPGVLPYRYFRFYVSAVQSGNNAALAEIEARATVGGANQLTGGTASASSLFSGTYVASRAVDGNPSTEWLSNSGSPPHWWQYDAGEGADLVLAQLAIRVRAATADNSPVDFIGQLSRDGSNWDDIITVTGETGWSAGEQRLFTP